MNVAEILEKRKPEWKELEQMSMHFRKRVFQASDVPGAIARFTALYRGVCSDLALAESYQLPDGVVAYLNRLVGLAHHQLYRTQLNRRQNFTRSFLVETPAKIMSNFFFWLAMILFWGTFFLCWGLGSQARNAEKMLSEEELVFFEKMYDDENFFEMDFSNRVQMSAYYVFNNAGIGLRTFALGVFGGIGAIFITVYNAFSLGIVFGYMSSTEVSNLASSNFFEFTRAHSAFELMAVVLAAAAGIRIGFSFFYSFGFRRLEAVRMAAKEVFPQMVVFVVFFCCAAFIEAFISPSPLDFLESWPLLSRLEITPLGLKTAICIASSLLIFVYIVVLGGLALYREPELRHKDVLGRLYKFSEFSESIR